MLIPAFSGHGFKAYDKNKKDITEKLFKGFMIVDADYTPKPYEEWTVQDWPETYQNPSYKIFLHQELHLRHHIQFLNQEQVKTEHLFFLHHQEQECHQELQQN